MGAVRSMCYYYYLNRVFSDETRDSIETRRELLDRRGSLGHVVLSLLVVTKLEGQEGVQVAHVTQQLAFFASNVS